MPLMAALLAFVTWTVIKGTTGTYAGFATKSSGSSLHALSNSGVPANSPTGQVPSGAPQSSVGGALMSGVPMIGL